MKPDCFKIEGGTLMSAEIKYHPISITPDSRLHKNIRSILSSLGFGALSLSMALVPPLSVSAQGFDSGSNGSDGALNVTTNIALPLPPDGIFHYTTINVASGVTLTFEPNPLNTPVYLLATGNITVAGTIDVVGEGGTTSSGGGGVSGPGGFNGGHPSVGGGVPGDGFGPGAGTGGLGGAFDSDVPGSAGYGTPGTGPVNTSPPLGVTYGSPLLIPLVGGSGGGGGPLFGGAGGGGAILLSSNTQVNIDGSIRANGGRNTGNSTFDSNNQTGQASGGAIRIVAPLVSGDGNLSVARGSSNSGGNYGGHGRVRIDLIDRSQYQLSLTPNVSELFSMGAFMTVFPPNLPKLDILNVAGKVIVAGSPANVLVDFGSPASQPITVQATDFPGTGLLPIDIVLTPDIGPRVVVPAEIDLSSGNPLTMNVNFPINVVTHVNVWTRSVP